MSEESAIPQEDSAAVRLVNLTLLSALHEGADQVNIHWRADDFSITFQRGQSKEVEIPAPPARLWEEYLERLDALTTWRDDRTGLFRIGYEGQIVDCHVLARRRDLSCKDYQLVLETIGAEEEGE